MANELYYYDNTTNSIKTVAPKSTVESFPSLDTIKSFLQHDAGVLTPLSILTVDSNSFLDMLKVGQLQATSIIKADLDGGNF